jgi:hypothetical protein
LEGEKITTNFVDRMSAGNRCTYQQEIPILPSSPVKHQHLNALAARAPTVLPSISHPTFLFEHYDIAAALNDYDDGSDAPMEPKELTWKKVKPYVRFFSSFFL